MIEVKDLHKYYGDQLVLNGINFVFLEGKTYFIIGESGCGKTTLLNILSLEEDDYEGIVLYNNEDIKEYNSKKRKQFHTHTVSYINQFPVLFQDINVEENIKLPKYVNKKTIEKTASFLKSILMKRKTKKLSVGEKQRVCIQRIISQNTRVILADEPTASLDNEYKKEVLKELKKISKDKILIVVSHDLELAKEFADEILEIKKGRIKKCKTKQSETKFFDEEHSKKISLIDAYHLGKQIYKSERKRTSIYNYSLVIGIVLMSFTNMLSDGMMKYFQNQLMKQDSSNTIEYDFSYRELSHNEYLTLIEQSKTKTFQNRLDATNVETLLKFDDKYISIPSEGAINYCYDPSLEENTIKFKANEEGIKYFNEVLRLNVLGIDFCEYISIFEPEGSIIYNKEDITYELDFIADEVLYDEDIYFEICSSDEKLKDELLIKFCLEQSIIYKDKIDEELVLFLDGQNEIFYHEERLYKYIGGGLNDLDLISDEKEVYYGNIDFCMENLEINNNDLDFNFVFNTNKTLKGRFPTKKDEIVISSSLEKTMFNESSIGKLLTVQYKNNTTNFNVVGVINDEQNNIYYNQLNYEFLLEQYNTFINYKKFPIKEIYYLKNNINYEVLIEWDKKQTQKYSSQIIEVLKGMVPTMEGIKIIMRVFSFFTLLIAVVTLFVLTVLEFENKNKEYKMLKRTGYNKKDILRINFFKYFLSTTRIIIFSFVLVEITKVMINDFIGKTIGIPRILSNYNYSGEIISYSLLSFLLSIINFKLYVKLGRKRNN